MVTKSGKGMIGPPRLHQDTSTWGKRLKIRPGVRTTAVPIAGTGIGEDIGIRKRMIDVRVQTARPGLASKPFVLYMTRTLIFDPSQDAFPAGLSGAFQKDLIGVLETGSGGITREEKFIVPAHGRAIHIGADSVRLYMVYLPLGQSTAGSPNSLAAMTGFDIGANASISGLYPGEVRQESDNFSPGDTELFEIPQFAETLRLTNAQLSSIDVQWRDRFGNSISDFGSFNGTAYAEPQPIPLAATHVELELSPLAPAGAPATQLRWFRPS